MDNKSKTDLYAQYINSYILPFIDYGELQKSYDTDMEYAKGILNRLHKAMITVYGGNVLNEQDSRNGFVLVPGVVCGRESKKLGIALLSLDLSSSGEHWGTDFLCKFGVIPQDGYTDVSRHGVQKSEAKKIISSYVPYDYAYTAGIHDDIHVDSGSLPDGIKAVLADFPNHHAVLQFEHETLAADEAALCKAAGGKRPSALGRLREAKGEVKKPRKDKTSKPKKSAQEH